MKAFLLVFIISMSAYAQNSGLPPDAASVVSAIAGQAITPASVTSKVINGVSYSAKYSGSDYGARANACLQDACLGTNGNYSGKCSSIGEANFVSQITQITAGGPSCVNQSQTWEIPSNMISVVTLTDGTKDAIYAYPGIALKCDGPVQQGGCSFQNHSASNNIRAMYEEAPQGGQAGYYTLDGFRLLNTTGGTFASGALALFPYGFDHTRIENNEFEDFGKSGANSTADIARFGGTGYSPGSYVCCSVVVRNNFFGTELGTAIPLHIETDTFGVDFQDNTYNLHGSTTSLPNIQCDDPNGNSVIATFTGYNYMEGTTGARSTAWFKNNGCHALNMAGATFDMDAVSAVTNLPLFMEITTSSPTSQASIGNVIFEIGAGNNPQGGWSTFPGYAVKQDNTASDCASPPCSLGPSNSQGIITSYSTGTSGSITYPSAGYALSTGTGWGTPHLADNGSLVTSSEPMLVTSFSQVDRASTSGDAYATVSTAGTADWSVGEPSGASNWALVDGTTGNSVIRIQQGAPATSIEMNNSGQVDIPGGLGISVPSYGGFTQIHTSLYTVSSGTGQPALPAASSVSAGTMVTVVDATTFTPGTCTGGGSDYVIAISNGTSWSCH